MVLAFCPDFKVRIPPRPCISVMHLFIYFFVTDFVRFLLLHFSPPASGTVSEHYSSTRSHETQKIPYVECSHDMNEIMLMIQLK